MKKNRKKIRKVYIEGPIYIIGFGLIFSLFSDAYSWFESLTSSLLVILGLFIGYTGRDIEVLDGDTDPVLGDLFKKGETVPEESR
ncbi:hypothetical protein [Pseudobacteriovorax antillogorgiicola]|uniref:Uncharacterized protein n=1 Tax=Pseudobacteriovorax antillogorgiicola TaxID=1513793 RepID=A0A1Y6CPW5_9BACT|nr:hypothetical protein [Pseudobacteriovorax antillogorgiicola]TCS44243.1 hypothetical protein EDD56_13443 [Pseudobacteriovorax antillogorgiicola]SMF80701.1 hypothetical protein SAMN06296036_13544 [Pseudobacteriovorax antillogorgiicola]